MFSEDTQACQRGKVNHQLSEKLDLKAEWQQIHPATLEK